MNLLKKCPRCNNQFTFIELLTIRTSIDNKGFICPRCNAKLSSKTHIYKYIYTICIAIPLTVYILNKTNAQSGTFLGMLIILIILNILTIPFDIFEHRFNEYKVDEKN